MSTPEGTRERPGDAGTGRPDVPDRRLVLAQLVAGQDEQLRSLAAEAPGIGPIGTPLGARDCADALGIPSDAGLLVDVADVDGRPAAVLVVDSGTGRQAYAVERSCTTGTAGPISGPVPVD